MSSKASPSLLSIAAFFMFVLFLYSTASYPAISTGTTSSDKTLLASKALLQRRDINAYLSPHIYSVFIDQEYQLTELAEGDLEGAETCMEHAKQFCWTNTLHVARVTFLDAGATWTLCHCVQRPHQARLSKDEICDPEPWSYLLSHLSRLPTSLRQHIYTILLVPASRSPLATPLTPSTSSNISQREKQTPVLPHGMFTSSPSLATFFGYPGIGTWIHEFTHSADFHHSSAMFSSSVQWKRALEKDSCIADGYARTSRVEALAQAAIVKYYLDSLASFSSLHASEILSDGSPAVAFGDSQQYLDPLIGDYSCMRHQLAAIECFDTLHAFTGSFGKCIEPEDLGRGALVEENRNLVPRRGTWWEMWLVTNMLIILIMLAQL